MRAHERREMMAFSTPSAIDHPLISEVLFYPARLEETDVPPLPSGRIAKIPAGRDVLGAYHYAPLPHAPTVLFFHGNGEIMTDYLLGYHRAMENAGANFLVVDYRGYGLSSGRPSLSTLRQDARAAWDHAVEKLALPPSRLIIMGRSLGSLAALELAAGPARTAAALVLESAIARFDHWIDRLAPILQRLDLDLNALKQDLRRHFDHQSKIRKFSAPVLLLHALHDEIVPVEHARLLLSWAEPRRTTLHLFDRGGHNDLQLLNQEEYFQVIRRFFASLSTPG